MELRISFEKANNFSLRSLRNFFATFAVKKIQLPKGFIISILVSCSTIFSAQSIDLKILKSLNKNTYPVWDNVMWGTSASIFASMPLSVAVVGIDGLIHKDPVMQRNAVKSAITVGFATFATTTLK